MKEVQRDSGDYGEFLARGQDRCTRAVERRPPAVYALNTGTPRNGAMRIEDWIAEESERLQRFSAYWAREHAKKPNEFPNDMEPSDWDEAYMTFDE